MGKESKTFLLGRNANDGKFASVKTARKHPSTYIVERIPKAGYGDTRAGHKKKYKSFKDFANTKAKPIIIN